jgi:hypothetical protein
MGPVGMRCRLRRRDERENGTYTQDVRSVCGVRNAEACASILILDPGETMKLREHGVAWRAHVSPLGDLAGLLVKLSLRRTYQCGQLGR